MTLISEHIETITRERILVVAERLFRQIGYPEDDGRAIGQRAAHEPANVYRFSIRRRRSEGDARGLMGEVEIEAQRCRSSGLRNRLRELMKRPSQEHGTLCRRFQLHEMVEIAMEETGTFASTNAVDHGDDRQRDGRRCDGEFGGGFCRLASMCACTAMMRFFTPMIAMRHQARAFDRRMIDFVIAGLSPRAKMAGMPARLTRHADEAKAIHCSDTRYVDCFRFAHDYGAQCRKRRTE